jgi:hypothetical protein
MEIKIYKDFWINFGCNKCSGEGFEKKFKLKILNQYSNKIIENLGYNNNKSWGRRCSFERHHKWCHSLIKYPLCFVCFKKAKIRHHIIGLAKGGYNKRINFISVCKKCHGKIHRKLII